MLSVETAQRGKPARGFKTALIKSALLLGFLSGLVLVVFVSRAEDQMEIISLRHWLDAEVNRYYRDYEKYNGEAELPNRYEFDSYWSLQKTPGWLSDYQTPGYYEHHLGEEDKHFRVAQHPSGEGLFYIVFKDDGDDYLDQYESRLHWSSALMALVMCLGTAAGVVLVASRFARSLKKVAAKVDLVQPNAPEFSVNAPYAELRQIELALLRSKHTIEDYFQREQEFSRFTSHEIRTPLTVMRGSIDQLQRLSLESDSAARAIRRLDRACSEMALLTELFLLLGKNSIEQQHFAEVDLPESINGVIQSLSSSYPNAETDCVLAVESPCRLLAPPGMVKVLVQNLLRNALSHGHGQVSITLNKNYMEVSNRVNSAASAVVGFGYGTVIIDRIAQRLGWQVDAHQADGNYHSRVLFSH